VGKVDILLLGGFCFTVIVKKTGVTSFGKQCLGVILPSLFDENNATMASKNKKSNERTSRTIL
jgi:hypothetical protein